MSICGALTPGEHTRLVGNVVGHLKVWAVLNLGFG
jgi:hypothetical protein